VNKRILLLALSRCCAKGSCFCRSCKRPVDSPSSPFSPLSDPPQSCRRGLSTSVSHRGAPGKTCPAGLFRGPRLPLFFSSLPSQVSSSVSILFLGSSTTSAFFPRPDRTVTLRETLARVEPAPMRVFFFDRRPFSSPWRSPPCYPFSLRWGGKTKAAQASFAASLPRLLGQRLIRGVPFLFFGTPLPFGYTFFRLPLSAVPPRGSSRSSR